MALNFVQNPLYEFTYNVVLYEFSRKVKLLAWHQAYVNSRCHTQQFDKLVVHSLQITPTLEDSKREDTLED